MICRYVRSKMYDRKKLNPKMQFIPWKKTSLVLIFVETTKNNNGLEVKNNP